MDPSRTQLVALEHLHHLHPHALQRCTRGAQCKSLTVIRQQDRTFVTLAYPPDEYAKRERPSLAVEQEALKTEGRALSKALRGTCTSTGTLQARRQDRKGARAPTSPRCQPPQGPQPERRRLPQQHLAGRIIIPHSPG